ncbi:Ig lambda-2 chain V region [Sciurus carolinensis]|uniref:Ig lambda-2 chain V region n=1 Tax=Sciurus carolinensis TaxID=30640 RepID=A0AA41MS30_SCICA|nr:Ig lambda-2 chain V region [Sciurus carolinensis]MBZ3877113.1 Ig lambda-2 chain V region [Sciurus carolinensis]
MTWAPLLLTLLAHCTGSTSQAVVTQETSLTTTPGGTLTLTCGSSTGAVTTSNYAGWIQQKSSQVPQGIIGSTGTRLPGVPARFTGSLLGDKAALTITGAQAEDEATYYCILWFSNHVHSGICRWRSETKTPWLSLTLCP